MDWRVRVFSNPVIMAAMSKYLSLRDVGALAGTVKWSAAWREKMTLALRMRHRIALRWPRGARISKKEVDIIGAVQLKARQALLPVSAMSTFICWLGGCQRTEVPRSLLVCQENMPYASCRYCVHEMAPRHATYTDGAFSYFSARVGQMLKKYCVSNKLAKTWRRTFAATYVGSHVDIEKYPHKTQFLCADLDAYLAQILQEHNVHEEWAKYIATK